MKKIFDINPNNEVVLSTQDGVIIKSNSNKITRLTGIIENDKPRVELHALKGTYENPQAIESGDYGVTLSFTTHYEKNNKDIGKSIVSLLSQIDVNANSSDIAPASNLTILVGAGDNAGEVLNNYMGWQFKKDGSFDSKIFQCREQTTASINNITPKNGMIIYNSEIHKFQGYANGEWVDLH